MRKKIAKHSLQILKLESPRVPWTWMFICGFATLIPMLVGVTQQDIGHSIYGGLCGYLIGLVDHNGTLPNRLMIATLGFVANLLFFSLGILLQHEFMIFILFTAIAIYGLGLFGGLGAELERSILLAIVLLLIGRYATRVTPEMLPSLFLYFIVGYATVAVGILISNFTFQNSPGIFKTVRESAAQFFTMNRRRHFYALSYMTAVILALFVVEIFEIQRGYWTAVTVLLITRPDRKESIYRIFQRMFGTFLGVVCGEIILDIGPNQISMLFIASGCAFLVPFVWNRNYWLVSFLATNIVIMLLSIALFGGPNNSSSEQITHVRLVATIYGCLISLVTIGVFNFIEVMVNELQSRSKK